MKILFLTPEFPYPPQQGGSIRVYNFLVHLSVRHELHILSFAEREPKAEALDHLREHCRSVEIVPTLKRSTGNRLRTLLFSGQPDMATRRFSPQFQEKLDFILKEEKFDFVQVESLEMAPYIDLILKLRKDGKPLIIFDNLNVEYLLQRRAWETDLQIPSRWGEALYSLMQWRRLFRYEARTLQKVDGTLAVSEKDENYLRQLTPGARVAVVPNGVDPSHYQSGDGAGEEGLIFVGKMDFRPNVDAVLWFTQKIWPLIRGKLPKTKFWVVGLNPSPRLNGLKRDPQVVITGEVPDVRPYLARAAVVVVPLRMGSGTRLKVLEAMAMGKAVVTTTLGCEGIAAQNGQEVALADSAQEFARFTLELLRDREKRIKMGEAARRLVQEKYDWRAIVPRLEEFYPRVLG